MAERGEQPMRLRVAAAETALVIVDIQSRLMTSMDPVAFDALTHNVMRLVATAERLHLPVALSEQYPQGLGATVPLIKEATGRLPTRPIFIEKTAFSLADEPLFLSFLGNGRKTLIVVGMETHICVYQTARGLAERGYAVHVPEDAVISRTEANHRIGLDLIRQAGGVPTSTETVIFDLLGRAGTDEFRALSKLMK